MQHREYKRVNRIFTAIVITSIVFEMAIGIFLYDVINLDNLIANVLLIEVIMLLPAIIGITIYRDEDESLKERLGFNKMKPKAVLATVLYAFLVLPIGTFANAISLLFTTNTVSESRELYLNQDFLIAFACVAIVAPFVEEFIFRAVIYKGYRKSGGRAGAVILSALLFGLIHMNLNQLIYAFVLGIFFAFVVEAADSVWASVLCHFIFNAENVVMMFVTYNLDPDSINDSIYYSKDEIIESIVVYGIVSIVAIVLAILILKWISNIQDTHEKMVNLLSSRHIGEKKAKLISPMLIVGIVISVMYIALFELLRYIEPF